MPGFDDALSMRIRKVLIVAYSNHPTVVKTASAQPAFSMKIPAYAYVAA